MRNGLCLKSGRRLLKIQNYMALVVRIYPAECEIKSLRMLKVFVLVAGPVKFKLMNQRA